MRALSRLIRRLALVALVALLAGTGAAGAQVPERGRPDLPDGADPNDWEAYYDLGADYLRRDAYHAVAAFEWAAALRPDLADPLFARWCVYWTFSDGRFEQYLKDDERVLREPKVIRIDSLRRLAFRRNPFLHQGLVIKAYEKLPGRWREDELTSGWIALGGGQLDRALERFGHLVARNPERYGYLRFVRASAFVNTARPDSAAAELDALLAQLRAAEAKTVGSGYESKEMLEYARGLLLMATRRTDAARDAFGAAALENPAFAPAHAMLGQLAAARRDSTIALQELGLAVELDPGDPKLRLDYGNALVNARRARDAIPQLERAIALAPFFAEPYYQLAVAEEIAGDKPAASARYAEFLRHALRSDPRRATAAQGAGVGAGPGAGGR